MFVIPIKPETVVTEFPVFTGYLEIHFMQESSWVLVISPGVGIMMDAVRVISDVVTHSTFPVKGTGAEPILGENADLGRIAVEFRDTPYGGPLVLLPDPIPHQ